MNCIYCNNLLKDISKVKLINSFECEHCSKDDYKLILIKGNKCELIEYIIIEYGFINDKAKNSMLITLIDLKPRMYEMWYDFDQKEITLEAFHNDILSIDDYIKLHKKQIKLINIK